MHEESLREKERAAKQIVFDGQDQGRFAQRLHSIMPSHVMPSTTNSSSSSSSSSTSSNATPSSLSTSSTTSSSNPYETPTNTNLYFGNLPPSMTDLRLYTLCAYYGRVVSVIVKKPRGGEGEGDRAYSIGFVNMMSHEEAELIIQKLNKYSVEVRK